jgi:HK97 gp10 family phage protein
VGKARVKCRVESRAIQSLMTKLAALDRKVARKAIRKGLNEAAKVVMWEAKALVPKRTGALRKSIGRKIWVKKGGAAVAAIIGPRKGFRVVYLGKPIDPVKYAHLVEFGRREVVAGVAKGKPTGKKALSSGKSGGKLFGKRVRSVAPRPFMRPAWERNKTRVVGIVIKELVAGIKAYYARGPVKFRPMAA